MTQPQSLTYSTDDNDIRANQGWQIYADFEPGHAFYYSNSTGLTIGLDTGNGPYNE